MHRDDKRVRRRKRRPHNFEGVSMAYFANGTEGMIFDKQCAECPLWDKACPIYLVQLEYNYSQCNEKNGDLRAAMNLLVDKKGICQMKPLIEQSIRYPTSPNQLSIPFIELKL
jgi:hypothetical protein